MYPVPLRDGHFVAIAKRKNLVTAFLMWTRLPPAILLLSASPAFAWSGIQIPEPSNIALFGMGLTGLIIGRQLAKRKSPSKDD